jgi:hypothetical protein
MEKLNYPLLAHVAEISYMIPVAHMFTSQPTSVGLKLNLTKRKYQMDLILLLVGILSFVLAFAFKDSLIIGLSFFITSFCCIILVFGLGILSYNAYKDNMTFDTYYSPIEQYTDINGFTKQKFTVEYKTSSDTSKIETIQLPNIITDYKSKIVKFYYMSTNHQSSFYGCENKGIINKPYEIVNK